MVVAVTVVAGRQRGSMAGAPQTTVLNHTVASGRSLYARTSLFHTLRASIEVGALDCTCNL